MLQEMLELQQELDGLEKPPIEQNQELREWMDSHLSDIQSQSWFETLCMANLPKFLQAL